MTARHLTRWQHLLVLCLVVAAIYSRRPDALLNPQFYAEDGAVWYANAWNLGWLHSLTLPEGGYLNTLPRLLCGLAILVPLKSAPLLLNWFGILIQALPVTVLLSARCSNWGPLWIRMLQSVLYVALPNSYELDVTVTNAHWHLALAACFVAFADAPTTPGGGKLFDVTLLLLVGLTGPWAIVLTPLVLVFWWMRRQRWSLVMAGVLAFCVAIQVWELLVGPGNRRPTTPLGATPELLLRLVAGHVYAGALWGQNLLDLHGHLVVILPIFAVGTAVLVWGLLKLRLEMKLFIVFALLILVAALHSPLISGDQPRWQLLALDKGSRYWFFPMLALVWTLLWSASYQQQKLLRIFSVVCFGVMLRAVCHDWRYLPYEDLNFGYQVKRFEAAAPGQLVEMPVVPAGHVMVLLKRTAPDGY